MSIERAKSLMGINEGKSKKQSSHLTNIIEAKDRNTYAIIKENSEYVVKVLNSTGDRTNILDYNYVGGLANKRNFVYESHRTAVKQLSAKVSLISETYGTKMGLVDGFTDNEPSGVYDSYNVIAMVTVSVRKRNFSYLKKFSKVITIRSLFPLLLVEIL